MGRHNFLDFIDFQFVRNNRQADYAFQRGHQFAPMLFSYSSMTLLAKSKSIKKIADYSSYVIMAFIFSIPISTSIANILAILIALLWVIEGNFKEKFAEIRKNKVTLAVLAYVLLHVVGLLWTSDYSWGFYTIKKQWKLLMLPVFLTMVKKEHIDLYLGAFVAAMIISALTSYLIFFDLINIANSNHYNPSPFIKHVMYNPLLALAIYILCHYVTNENSRRYLKMIDIICIILLTINMFMVPGRTGQLAFFMLMFIFTCQLFFKKLKKMAFIIFFSCLIIPLISYGYIPSFNKMVNNTISNIEKFDVNAENSLAERVTFVIISTKIIKENFYLGVGTGDFPPEYEKAARQEGKYGYGYTENPHNQYLLVLSQFGVTGLILFLSIFYFQINSSLLRRDGSTHIMLAFPLFFLFIFMGDSYLQTSGTSLLFSIFSSFLYKECY